MSDPVFDHLAAASVAEQEGRIDDATRILAELGDAINNRPAGLHLAGIVAARRQNYAAARHYMLAALDLAPSAGMVAEAVALIHRNLAEVHRRLRCPADAVAAGRAALALMPDDPITLNNLGVAQFDAHDYNGAIASFDRAIALTPDAAAPHFGRGEVLLSLGDYDEGWKGYGWRFRLAGVPAPVPAELIAASNARAWDGAAFDGTLLLAADQGFGDVVQFSRLIPWAAARCTRLLVAASPEILPVIAQFPMVAQVDADWARIGAFDAWATLSDLPAFAGVTADALPGETIPYLHADSARVASWRARLDQLAPTGLRRIGLAWAGRPTHPSDFARSMKLAELAPLAALPGTAFVSLQKGEAQGEIGGYFGSAPLINIGAEIVSYDDTMAVIAGLDLVVTVDTSVAHIAGAMGCPVWMLVAHRSDWRWGNGGGTTGWYPSMRIFRQNAPAAWDGPVEQVVSTWLAM
ncbi:MAG: tetratricopeptide repeat protein [Acetobacteraceae bacterium]|nr:tetratricopeptide repeat protein [Acetobacteraceae bacterium]